MVFSVTFLKFSYKFSFSVPPPYDPPLPPAMNSRMNSSQEINWKGLRKSSRLSKDLV